MTALKNTSLVLRLYLGYGTILFIMIVLTALGISDVRTINSQLTEINDVNSVKQRYAINFRGSVHDRAIAVRDMVLLSDPQALQETIAEIQKLAEDYTQSAAAMDALFRDKADLVDREERRILASIKEIESTTLPLIDKILADVARGDMPAANDTLLINARPNFVIWLARINEFIDLEENKNSALTESTRAIADSFQRQMLLFSMVAVFVGVAVAVWIIWAIKPLAHLTGAILDLKDGKLDIIVPPVRGDDEVGQITGALTVFRDNAIEAKAMQEAAALREAQQKEAEQARIAAEQQAREERQKARAKAEEENRAARRKDMLALAQEFEDSVMGLVQDLAQSADQMKQAADQMSARAADTVQDAESVSQSSRSASDNATSVSSSARALSTSVRDVTTQTHQSSETARVAVDQTERASEDVSALEGAAQRIGDVVNLINDIAEQTNLLALNATIEAARAGEAGKGFAVVASEVKSLAKQTANATQEISGQVASMQDATTKAVSAIHDIRDQIRTIGDTSVTIAEAVQQQDTATQDIARNIDEVSSGTDQVTQTIANVTKGASDTGADAKAVLDAALQLSEKSGTVRVKVQAFLETIRAN